MILGLRTDRPEAELLLLNQDGGTIEHMRWQAHRQLAETLHAQFSAMLKKNNLTYQDVKSIVVYQGPGSFTGLRIGISVANALAYSQGVPIVATTGDAWVADGIALLSEPDNHVHAISPEYGAPVHITQQKK
jgi:tRNA threonylcarbamoyladenosine biosynthesis protein TsaB